MTMTDEAYAEFRDQLFEAGLLVGTGVDGLYLRSRAFEEIVTAIDALVTRAGTDLGAACLYFPLVMPRGLLETTDYVRSFPDMTGVVTAYAGGADDFPAFLDRVDKGEWAPSFEPTDVALCSAACHPLYPSCAGRLPEGGRYVEVFGNCFRREPSVDPARMQVFRQHEFVYLGDPAGAAAHRDRWVERGLDLHASIGLEIEAVVANDPFFGRTGRMLAANQRSDALKIELVSPICSTESPTAITSANCHLDHFGLAFGIESFDGDVAHTACVGFGVERIALALLHTHGLDPDRWSSRIRVGLGL
jgi:seryl-tRNA synthetase